MAASPNVGARLGRVAHGAGHLPAVVFPASLRRLWLALAGSIVFVVIGVVLLLSAGTNQRALVAGVVAVLVFGVFAIGGIYGLVRDVSSVAISAAGLHGGSRSEVFVPWSALVGTRVLTIRGTSMVGLEVTHPSAVRMPRRLLAVGSLNRRWFGMDLAIGGPSDRPRAELIAQTIAYYAEDVQRRTGIGLALPPLDGLPSKPNGESSQR